MGNSVDTKLSEGWKLRFARHAGGSGPNKKQWVQEWLFDTNRIGLHYDNIASFNESRYENGSGSIRRLNRAVDQQTLVVVAFSELKSRTKYLAVVQPDSREVHAIDLDDDSIVDSTEIEESEGEDREFEQRYEDEYSFEKTVRVSDWMPVTYEERKPLWHWQTPTSLHGVSKDSGVKRDYAKAVFEGGKTPKSVAVLSNDDQEFIAAHWLQNEYEDFRLDAPVGGNLQYIDILGSTESERVVGSVTYASYDKSRIEDLNSYKNDSIAYYFGRGPDAPDRLAEEVNYVSLGEVFDWMDTEGTRRQRSLHVMLGYDE